MEIENFKRWHWIVISLILGAIIGSVMVSYGVDVDSYNERSLNLATFEDLVIRHNMNGPAIAEKITVYPLSPIQDVVIGSVVYYDREFPNKPPGDKNPIVPVVSPFLFTVRGPDVKYYHGQELVGPATSFKSNREYLEKLTAKFPDAKINFRFAWWVLPPATVALWMAGTLVVVGGVWPTLLNVLVGAGYGPKREPKVDYRKRAAEQIVTKRTEMTAAERDQLSALEAKLGASVADFLSNENDPDDAMSGRPATPAVKKLETTPVEESAPAAKPGEKEEIKYGGTFYPTITRVKKKDQE